MAAGAGDDATEKDAQFSKKVVEEFFRLFFSPEIERRQAAGLQPDDFQLHMAQAILLVH